jgi:hypothetical protein
MAEDKNKIRNREGDMKQQVGRSGRRPGQAPQTTETGGQNSGGQTERAGDKTKKNKQSGGR